MHAYKYCSDAVLSITFAHVRSSVFILISSFQLVLNILVMKTLFSQISVIFGITRKGKFKTARQSSSDIITDTVATIELEL